MISHDRLLRRPEVSRITGMTRYLIDVLEQNGSFPKRMLVGRRNVYWSEAEITEFVNQTKSMRIVAATAPGDEVGAPDSAKSKSHSSNCAVLKPDGGRK